HDSRHARQLLANGDARHLGCRRLEDTPHALGGVGFHVEGLKLARSAELVKGDDGFCLGRTAAALLPRAKEIRQRQAEQAKTADLEQAAASHACLAKSAAG